ncbi:MAG: AAA family ATPase [Candidatus Woesearchaeota archaeon]|nr:AAA family ATPase [Candidatus Woesearchaeota archaeon]
MADSRKGTGVSGSARVATGIPGFDSMIGGGFLPNSVNLLSGGTGTGKTLFAMQFLYNGAMKGESGLFISMEEDLSDLKDDAKAMGWDFDKLEKEERVSFIYVYPYNISDFQSQLISQITDKNAKRVVIDSTSVFGMALEDEYEVRKQLYTFASQLKRLNCTTILTSEIVGDTALGSPSNSLSRFGVEEFVSDSVIVFYYSGLGGEGDRAFRIMKMRRTDHAKGVIPFKITEKGIIVLSKENSYR